MSNNSLPILCLGIGVCLGILFTLVAQNKTDEPVNEVRDKADLITILLISIIGLVSILVGVEIFG